MNLKTEFGVVYTRDSTVTPVKFMKVRGRRFY